MSSIIYSGVMSGKNGFTDALRKVFDNVIDCQKEALEHQPVADLVFLQPQDTGISINALKHLKSLGAYIINWTGDIRNETPRYCYEYAPYVDLTCFSNMRDVEHFRRNGFNSEFLQIGYDPAIYYPAPNGHRDIDVCFMGNHYGHFPLSNLRRQVVTELKRVYGDRFKAYGINQPDGNLMGDQAGEAVILRRSKIAINLSHYNEDMYTSDRVFRALGSGCVVLSHKFKNYHIEFSDLMIMWDSINELKQKINDTLDDPEFMRIVNELSYAVAKDKFTFEHMAQSIKKLYEQYKA